MRPFFIAMLFVLSACSPKGQITLGECPAGTSDDGSGNCIEDDPPETEPEDPETEPETESETDTGGEIDCEIGLAETVPITGAEDIYWWSDVTFILDGTDPSASITVETTSGESISGTTTVLDTMVTWTADDGLNGNESYVATIDWCNGEEYIEFSTGSRADPLETDVTGETYALDLGSATWVKPEGIGSVLGDGLDVNILVGVEDASDDLDFVVAIAETGTVEQDYCLPTLDFEPTDFDYSPYFVIGPVDMPISLLGYSVTIYDVDIFGKFIADGSGMEEVELAGAIDLRDLGDLLVELLSVPPDAACILLGTFGVSCNACSSDGEELCIDVELTEIIASATGEVVELVEEANTHPECDTEAE